MQNNSIYKNIQIHVQYKIVISVINIIISYFVVNGRKPYFLVHSLVFIFFILFAKQDQHSSFISLALLVIMTIYF